MTCTLLSCGHSHVLQIDHTVIGPQIPHQSAHVAAGAADGTVEILSSASFHQIDPDNLTQGY